MESVVDLGKSIIVVCFLVALLVGGGLVFVRRPGPPELRGAIQIIALLIQHAILLAVLWSIHSVQLVVVIQTAFLLANSFALTMLYLRASGRAGRGAPASAPADPRADGRRQRRACARRGMPGGPPRGQRGAAQRREARAAGGGRRRAARRRRDRAAGTDPARRRT